MMADLGYRAVLMLNGGFQPSWNAIPDWFCLNKQVFKARLPNIYTVYK